METSNSKKLIRTGLNFFLLMGMTQPTEANLK
jgi:hypothetical protein